MFRPSYWHNKPETPCDNKNPTLGTVLVCMLIMTFIAVGISLAQ